jgi:hypothetical protein
MICLIFLFISIIYGYEVCKKPIILYSEWNCVNETYDSICYNEGLFVETEFIGNDMDTSITNRTYMQSGSISKTNWRCDEISFAIGFYLNTSLNLYFHNLNIVIDGSNITVDDSSTKSVSQVLDPSYLYQDMILVITLKSTYQYNNSYAFKLYINKTLVLSDIFKVFISDLVLNFVDSRIYFIEVYTIIPDTLENFYNQEFNRTSDNEICKTLDTICIESLLYSTLNGWSTWGVIALVIVPICAIIIVLLLFYICKSVLGYSTQPRYHKL